MLRHDADAMERFCVSRCLKHVWKRQSWLAKRMVRWLQCIHIRNYIDDWLVLTKLEEVAVRHWDFWFSWGWYGLSHSSRLPPCHCEGLQGQKIHFRQFQRFLGLMAASVQETFLAVAKRQRVPPIVQPIEKDKGNEQRTFVPFLCGGTPGFSLWVPH